MFLVLRRIRDMRIDFRLRLALVRLSFFLRLFNAFDFLVQIPKARRNPLIFVVEKLCIQFSQFDHLLVCLLGWLVFCFDPGCMALFVISAILHNFIKLIACLPIFFNENVDACCLEKECVKFLGFALAQEFLGHLLRHDNCRVVDLIVEMRKNGGEVLFLFREQLFVGIHNSGFVVTGLGRRALNDKLVAQNRSIGQFGHLVVLRLDHMQSHDSFIVEGADKVLDTRAAPCRRGACAQAKGECSQDRALARAIFAANEVDLGDELSSEVVVTHEVREM
mmetsp:Transcript_65619/g.106365  ORF Transcript_65619/g.106365 Transcript_65619/m.106365 type:complete len:278 (+) Transcript_65619:998-1831(+)